MPVGDLTFPEMHPVAGFTIGTTAAGVRYQQRRDLVVMGAAVGSTVGAVFTQNAFCAAPVSLCKQNLKISAPRYCVINTGNANAGTGAQGDLDAISVCAALAKLTDSEPHQILPFSTGVIGEPLPVAQIVNGLPDAVAELSVTGWEDAANGIMTTDTLPKGASSQLEIDGHSVTITGIAKGSGMIHPNMATMLAYIATDAAIESDLLQSMVEQVVAHSFNRITIDGDTSTNDSFVVIATGKSTLPNLIVGESSAARQFMMALEEVALELAHKMVRDGEGATKFVTIKVTGAESSVEALNVAFTVAHSPLVKTALFASDPNWGRILAAIGRSEVDNLDVSLVKILLDDVVIVESGGRASSYSEELGQEVMDRDEIVISIDIGRGDASETVWTTDLSHEYVQINAEYRT
ncbi:MAG: bifunctional glutamate N-acetyltransferase/amino-acid acetyltransferase ArgJ [Thiotrichales bacterium]|jgi:glutamate N-acetyltransferase/amino-acid N-acetyltransferase|nr:bifunctional glutamate N-acetyltransferase/amino-acid acetyltransferase ArgJ [Thiotrichales bacterium]MBT3614195.1 bifunctional glutamate N-acetyltransferase/amino-acid acetyltransferase ArgJ [Thiotrichales bacterium]MBT3752013.1 bifunctional glutamate N-acetyltransferase/amino-acid acetyltransferase ArgJ [Thiotrichales bacterium]MBT3837396.1 bifunctional glutamate N-acetyltransferase/amino-acid acetyltransferase ArgJ [Thiotrichales bacterium]MBT4152681.1 bifunctional glutamate N-acetyltrans